MDEPNKRNLPASWVCLLVGIVLGQVTGPCRVFGDLEAELTGVWTFWLVEPGVLSHSLLGARFGGRLLLGS